MPRLVSSLDRQHRHGGHRLRSRDSRRRLPRLSPSLVRSLLLPEALSGWPRRGRARVSDRDVSDRDAVSDAWRRLLDANMKYYEALGKVTSEYVAAVARVLIPLPRSTRPSAPNAAAGVRAGSVGGPPPTGGPVAKSNGPMLVLEGEAGTVAQAGFVISNGLPRAVTAPVIVSALCDEAGRGVRPAMRVTPGTLALAP